MTYHNALSSDMGFSISICSLILVSALLLTSEIKVGVADKTFSVLDYGAVGNGITDDSSVSGDIIAPEDPDAWKGKDKWLTFNSTLTINNCNDVSLQPVYFKNSPQMHLVVPGSSNVYLRSLDIYAPEWSPNTDGIHIGGSHGVVVRASSIGTGRASLSSDSICVGRGQVSQVDFSNLNFTAVENPIIINQYYCNTPGNCPKTASRIKFDTYPVLLVYNEALSCLSLFHGWYHGIIDNVVNEQTNM
ncbi:probable polygalacturonase At1g80170 [Eucalyptus grandis]|uniref:probable polygalacturonase At1g80170 n=1 Tax=Eucalyptus grandis TaxID=71139 RepID=UPI00192ED2EF|nr:probable polygalacturonase At1g80170 [Eucalyptus grandis]